MIDRGKDAEDEQGDGDLQRRLCISRQDRGDADADEEHGHHAVPAPAVRKPPRRQGEQAEGYESGRRVVNQLLVAQAPFARQRKCRHSRENQRKQMVEEMADIEEEKVCPLASHWRFPLFLLGST